jgi:hypothetical protein
MLQQYPAKLLLLIRNRISNDWESLCREFRLDPGQFHTGHSMLWDSLKGLHEAGLVRFEEIKDFYPSREELIKMKFEIGPTWERIQTALGISLTQLAKHESTEIMAVKPFFGQPTAPAVKSDIFVLMPFAKELISVYQDHITEVAKTLKLTVRRADDFFTMHSIMSDVWNAICDARLVIADCTGRNPNVFYEIGLAHTIGKSVLLITQDKEDIPFDIRHLRFIKYEFTPRGMKDFEKRLTETINVELMVTRIQD